MGNKYKKFAAARADMLPIKVQILNYFTNFKDKSTDRMPNVVVDLPALRIPKYFSHSVPSWTFSNWLDVKVTATYS